MTKKNGADNIIKIMIKYAIVLLICLSDIFDDINTKDILEEVIYTISMSIDANYEVKSVIFNVENEEIHKSVLKSIE